MTNPLSILKNLLFEYKERLEAAEETPADNKAKESELKVSEMSIGSKVETIDAEGNIQPAEDGEYTLESGDVIEVKDGLIATINGEGKPEEEAEVPVDAAEESPEENSKGENPNEEVETLKAKVSELEAKIAAIESAIGASATKEEVNEFKAEVSYSVGEFNKTLLTIANVPAEFSKTSSNNVVKDSKEEKMNAVFSIINSARKK